MTIHHQHFNAAQQVIWQPLQGSQALALSCPCNHILYEGTRGPGKTDAQLMKFRMYVGMGYGPFWKGIIFDREYKNLDDLISKSKRWFPLFKDGCKFLSSAKDLKWVWPTGEELLFRQIKKEDDYNNYHGHEYPFIGWNELTKHPNSKLYDAMMSTNRTSFLPEVHSPIDPHTGVKAFLPEIPLMVFSTTNPYGVGHNWVKQRFIDPAPPGCIVKIEKEVFNPRTGNKELVTKTQTRIFGSYKENKFLSPEYVLELSNITDQNKKKAWLWGDWDITAGGMFDDVWSTQYNVVPAFQVPPTWRMFRSFDWGSSKPFSVGWWAESDGSDLSFPDGRVMSTVKGDLFRVNEWYGWTGVDNTGCRMLATKIAEGIVAREVKFGFYGRVRPGPADASIYDTENGVCIANDMLKKVRIGSSMYKGVTWTRSIKTPGSRKTGWEKMRIAISNAQPNEHGGPRESPGLFVTHLCKDGFLRTVPTLTRDTKDLDDVDTTDEDHAADETRYVILAHGERFTSGTTTGYF